MFPLRYNGGLLDYVHRAFYYGGVRTTIDRFLHTRFNIIAFRACRSQCIGARFYCHTSSAIDSRITAGSATRSIGRGNFRFIIERSSFRHFNCAFFNYTTTGIGRIDQFTTIRFGSIRHARHRAYTIGRAASIAIRHGMIRFPLYDLYFAQVFLQLIARFTRVELTRRYITIDTRFTIRTGRVTLFNSSRQISFSRHRITLRRGNHRTRRSFNRLLGRFAFRARFRHRLTSLVQRQTDRQVGHGFVSRIQDFFHRFFSFRTTFNKNRGSRAAKAAIGGNARVRLFDSVNHYFGRGLIGQLTVNVYLVHCRALTRPIFYGDASIFFTICGFRATHFATTADIGLAFRCPQANASF